MGVLPDAEEIRRQQQATVYALIGISPRDELEGMLAAQLLACHNAAMECHRRAMLAEQAFEGRREALNQANKLSRTYATLLETLNRHRGKGQQKVFAVICAGGLQVRRVEIAIALAALVLVAAVVMFGVGR